MSSRLLLPIMAFGVLIGRSHSDDHQYRKRIGPFALADNGIRTSEETVRSGTTLAILLDPRP
ncbi:hypothetical protein ACFXHA_33255 [Nocardia sp. NPDC059240]|uniref:hypothetical protein n=1 Tax=Nocardia sp. NPDC059240 TaxID=3346786 RepID=UPI0036B3F5BD